MHHLLRLVLASSLLCLSIDLKPSFSENVNIQNFSTSLETALNSYDPKSLQDLISDKNTSEIQSNYERFTKRFSNLNWSILPLSATEEKEILLEIILTGERIINSEKYSLETRQLVKLEISEKTIVKDEVIAEQSILKSINSPLKIKINIPDEILTGSKYDADIILEEPLGDSFISGGLIVVDKNASKENPMIDLYPLGSGGLFKSVQAPLTPGKQILVALITHPKGIISITKIVQVR